MSAATVLRAQKENILQEWEDTCRREIDEAKPERPLILRDSFPHLVDLIVRALEDGSADSTTQEREIIAKDHAIQRTAITDYTHAELLDEYRILRQIIHRAIASVATTQDVIVVSTIMFEGLTDAGKEFARLFQDLLADRDMFVATLSHDMRQPLQVIRLSLAVVSRQPNRVDMLGRSVENVNKIDRLLTDMLDISQIRFGANLPIKPSEVNVTALLEELTQEINSTYGERLKFEPGEPIVGDWDKDYLRRAVENLVVNAVKYGALDRPIQLTLRREGEQVLIAVRNEGEPIAPEKLAQLFRAYSRLSTPEKPGIKGRGLGLALVKGIAEAHKGNVDVVSNAASGTTFTIRLPLRR